MTTKAIWIEYRNPELEVEKKCYGRTTTTGDFSKIFINKKRCKTTREEVITLWHELAHTFCHFHTHKLPAGAEEKLCERIGKIVWELL